METIASIGEQKTRLWAMAYEQSDNIICCENCGTINRVKRLTANCTVMPRRRPRSGPKDFTDIIAGHVEPGTIGQLLLSSGAMQPESALPIFRQVCRSLGRSPGISLQVTDSPAYMSPEQCLGKLPDERSQVYSLGCLLYEALTGKPPFGADEPLQIMMQHVQKEPPRLLISDYAGAVKLAAVLRRCLSKKPARRYQNLSALEAELTQLTETLVPQPCSKKLPGRAPALAAGIGLALLLGCLKHVRDKR
ncbi:MAG: protein kinase [Cyanobacteria bacterium SZAS LIN-2]|nr:protein kinase [Cyanobacteria bacterium SZAS LIN-2]